jgi:alkylation response protein AidB-like acyl-CoA dehydrogenase
MNFQLDEEQAVLQQVARDFLTESPDWGRIVEEAGWPAIVIPEAYGGWGFGHVELAVVFEEVGRALVSCPLLGTAAATEAILDGGSPGQKASFLGAIASGTPAALALDAEADLVDGRLQGVAECVVDGAEAGFVVVQTRSGELVVTDAFEAAELAGLDPSRQLARLCFDGAKAELLPDAKAARIADRVCALLAAESVGGAEACLDMAVDYAKVRRQFGKPIGSFQAIQHKCADMLLWVESARSAAWYAAWAMDQAPEELAVAARTAKAYACDAFFRCAGENIQIHGGIGFTWEHDAHRYFKRARASKTLYGEPRMHREAVADMIFGGE